MSVALTLLASLLAAAFLYQRDPSFMDGVADPEARRVFDYDHPDEPHCLEQRNKLRQDMRDHQYCRAAHYKCTYGGKDAEGKHRTSKLQEFETMVLRDLWEAICFEFPEQDVSNQVRTSCSSVVVQSAASFTHSLTRHAIPCLALPCLPPSLAQVLRQHCT